MIRNFIKNLQMAQKTALKKKKKVEVVWRGYTDVIDPSESVFTTSDLRGRLLTALRNVLLIHKINKLPKSEEDVCFTFNTFFYLYCY